MSRMINRLYGRVYGWFDAKEARPVSKRIPSKFNAKARLAILNLEDRVVPTVYTVTSVADDGSAGTLRADIGLAVAGDTIQFNTVAANGVNFADGTLHSISLTSGALALSAGITITGPGPNELAIVKGAGDTGAGISITNSGTDNISGLTIQGFSNTTYGGGLTWVDTVTPTVKLTNCRITGNTSTTTSYGGGGIYSGGGSLYITDCEISSNSTTSINGGGGIYAYDNSKIVIISSTIANNTSKNGGGGFQSNSSSTINIDNSTIVGNTTKTASTGAGINSISGTWTVDSSVIAGNTATTAADDISLTGATTTFIRSAWVSSFTPTTSTNNLADHTLADMNLGTLGFNGGPTQTFLPGQTGTSSLQDAGDNSQNLTFDQRLDPVFTPRVLGTAADIGSVEFGPYPGASTSAPLVVSPATQTPYTFTVTYLATTANPINTSTLGTAGSSNSTITVSKGSYTSTATFQGYTTQTSGALQAVVATYQIDNLPVNSAAGWDISDNGTYNINMAATATSGQQVKLLNSPNTAVPAGVLGTFTVAIAAPTATLTTAPNVTSNTTTAYTFTITYTGSSGAPINAASIVASGNTGGNTTAGVRVSPDGINYVNATLTNGASLVNGATVAATYSFNPSALPGGSWTASGSGSYTVNLVAGAVTSPSGLSNAAGDIGEFYVALGGTYPVTIATDPASTAPFVTGRGSLRNAIKLSDITAGTITFSSLFSTAQTITLASALPAITTSTTITGPGSSLLTISAASVTGSRRIFDATGATAGATLTISGMKLTGASSSSVGAAIDVVTDTGTFSDLLITGNTAAGGGAIAASSGAINITNSTISNNSSSSVGGAFDVTASGGKINVTSSLVTGNTANTLGGALYWSGVNTNTIKFTNSIISNNVATTVGGAVATSKNGGTLLISASAVTGNTAKSTTKGGGAFYLRNVALQINNSTISGNSAADMGGVAYILTTAGSVTISNSTIDGNKAILGGAFDIASVATAFTIYNSTILDNSSTSTTAGIGGAFNIPAASTLLIDSSVIARNSAGGSSRSFSTTISSTRTVTYSAWDDTGFTPTNTTTTNLVPVSTAAADTNFALGTLANNGGPVIGPTGSTTTTFTVAFPTTSTLVDKGENSTSNTFVEATDQRGAGITSPPSAYPRSVNGSPLTANGLPDIGSVEVGVAPIPTATATAAAVSKEITSGTSQNDPYTFTVSYYDGLTSVLQSSIPTTNPQSLITVTGPNGFSANANYISTASGGAGTASNPYIVTYQITPPATGYGAGWDQGDNGTYTINIAGNVVVNTAANPAYIPASTIGSFIVNLPAVATVYGNVSKDNDYSGTYTAGDTGESGITVFDDYNGNGIRDTNNATVASTNVPVLIPDNNPVGCTSTDVVSGLTGNITQVTVNLSLTHTYDSDIVATLTNNTTGASITLFSHVGTGGANFTNTTFSDSATKSITAGTAPYTGTFTPSPGPALSTFNGSSPDGTWTLFIVDTVAGDSGNLLNWSLNFTTDSLTEPSATTDANGNYTFAGLLPNSALPAGDSNVLKEQGLPANQIPLYTGVAANNAAGIPLSIVTGHEVLQGTNYYFGNNITPAPSVKLGTAATVTKEVSGTVGAAGVTDPYSFTVDYYGLAYAPSLASIEGANANNIVYVTNAAGFNAPATFDSVDSGGLGTSASPYVAHYHITPPGTSGAGIGTIGEAGWDYGDDGTYTISVNAGLVQSGFSSSYTLPASTVGTFTVNLPAVATVYGRVTQDANYNGVYDSGETGEAGVTVYDDVNGNGVYDPNSGTVTTTSGTVSISAGSSGTSTDVISGFLGNITHISVKIASLKSGTYGYPSYLGATLTNTATNEVITLFSPGDAENTVENKNFTNTVFDDSGTKTISGGTQPYTGTFAPDQALASFNGQSPDGTWVLTVTNNGGSFDSSAAKLGSWSITFTTDSPLESKATTDANGNYILAGLSATLPGGDSNVIKEVASTLPTGQVPIYTGAAANFAQGIPVSLLTGDEVLSGTNYYFGNNLNPSPSATITAATVTKDVTGTVGATGVTDPYSFTVNYYGLVSPPALSSITAPGTANNIVFVTNPDGYNAPATFVSVNSGGAGTQANPYVVNYYITPPGVGVGTIGETGWDFGDNGTYTVSVNGGIVQSSASAAYTLGNSNIGTFTVNLPPVATVYGNVSKDVDYSGTFTAGDTAQSGIAVFDDYNGNGIRDLGTGTFTNSTAVTINSATTTSTEVVSGLTGTITHMTVKIRLTQNYDYDLTANLIAPDGTTITLLQDVPNGGANFTNTVFDDLASTPINSGTAPYTGTFTPEQPLSTVSGDSPNGTWHLQILNPYYSFDTGKINSWSLSFTTNAVTEPVATTDANGNYLLAGLPTNSSLPAGDSNILKESGLGTGIVPIYTGAAANGAAGIPLAIVTGDEVFQGTNYYFGNNLNPAPSVKLGTAATVTKEVSGTIGATGVTDPYSFTVDYYGFVSPPSLSSLSGTNANNIVYVTNASGFSTPATFDSIDSGGAGTTASPYVVHYHITPPGTTGAGIGSIGEAGWDFGDNGTYTIKVNGGLVQSSSSSAYTLPAGTVGTFTVNLPAVATVYGHVSKDANYNGAYDAGETPESGIIVYDDLNGNGVLDTGVTTVASTNVPVSLGATTTSKDVVTGVPGNVLHLAVTLTLATDEDPGFTATLIAPDGVTSVVLFSGAGDYDGAGFQGTTFDDSASISIDDGSDPFSGTYQPEEALSTMSGQSANGTWKLQVSYDFGAPYDPSSLLNWSLSFTTYSEPNATTDTNGNYTLAGLPANSALPAGDSNVLKETALPTNQVPIYTGIAANNSAGIPLSLVTGNEVLQGSNYYFGNNINPAPAVTLGTAATVTKEVSGTVGSAGVTDPYSFTVDYYGLVSPPSLSSITGANANNIVYVTNAGGYDVPATFDGVDTGGLGTQASPYVAHYHITPPGTTGAGIGTIAEAGWDYGDNGTYTISVNGGLVQSSSSSAYVLPAGTVGTFTVNLPAVATVYGQVTRDVDYSGTNNAGDTPLAGVTVYDDLNGDGVFEPYYINTITSPDTNILIPDNNPTGAVSTDVVSGLAGVINHLTVNVSLTHTYDSDIAATLTSPSGTTITLWSHVGSFGQNFTNTTFDDSATTPITAGTAPFTGTFSPSPGALAAFNGQSPDGTWTLNIVDSVAGDSGNLLNWSLTFSSPDEPSAVSDANGNYVIGGLTPDASLPTGESNVIKQISPLTGVPSSYVQIYAGSTTSYTAGIPLNITNPDAVLTGVAYDFGDNVSPFPSAAATAATVTAGSTAPYQFTVTYTTPFGVDPTTVANNPNNITVSGPNGYTATAHLVGTPTGPNTALVATYQINSADLPYNGTAGWDAFDNGTYTIGILGGTVGNSYGTVNASPPAPPIGSFTVNVPYVPITRTVENNNDSGPGSLRQAIIDTNTATGTADTINFDPTVFSTSTPLDIVLDSNLPAITGALTINGAGVGAVTIDGNTLYKLFDVSSAPAGTVIDINNVTIQAGFNSGSGGAVIISNQDVTLDHDIITANAASNSGGGIFLDGTGALTISNSTISNNHGAFRGGGILVQGSDTVNVINTTISGNSTFDGGGGGLAFVNGYSGVGTLNVSRSTISGNVSGGGAGGGGVYLYGYGAFTTTNAIQTNISNSTITGNSAASTGTGSGYGGGIIILDSGSTTTATYTVSNSTIYGNTAAAVPTNGDAGGGIANDSGNLILFSTVVSGNTGKDIDATGGTNVATFSAVGVDPASTFFDYSDPSNLPFGTNLMLGTLAVASGASTATFEPEPGSPLIGHGSDTLAPLTPDVDQNGFGRTYGTGAAGTDSDGTDIGSVEVYPQVSNVEINNSWDPVGQQFVDQVQRSRVTSILVTFNEPVTPEDFATIPISILRTESASTSTGAVGQLITYYPTVTTISDASAISISQSLDTTSPNYTGPDAIRLTFSVINVTTQGGANPNLNPVNDAIQFGSLSDGRWTLSFGSGVNYSTPTNDNSVNANGNHTGLYRLFGDINADLTVDALGDQLPFGAAFGSSVGDPNYVAGFDFNNDGTIDALGDQLAFGGHFGVTLS